MVNYGVSPYAISFHPKYERGAERRPINDVDGHGHSALDRLKAALTAIQGDLLYPDDKDVTKFVRVTRCQVFDKFVFAEFGVARAGVEGNLHPSGAARVPIRVDDKSETYVRSVFFTPENGHEMFWLNERAGQTTAFGIFEKRLRNALRDSFGDFTYKCAPVADWAAVQAWAESVPVRDMIFVAPRDGSTSQSMDVNGVKARVEVRVKPKSRITLRRLLKEDGPDRNLVFGFLADSVFKAQSLSAESVIASGWSARVTFDTPSGRQRSFGLDTVDQDPTLVYQVGSVSDGQATLRPTDVEFLSACADFVKDADALIPSAASIQSDLRISTPN